MKLSFSLLFALLAFCALAAAAADEGRGFKPKKCFPIPSVKVGRTAFVDIEHGHDDSAEVEELKCPFKTLAEALAAVVAVKGAENWLIVVRPGVYAAGTINLVGGVTIEGAGAAATELRGRFLVSAPGVAVLRGFTLVPVQADQAPILTNFAANLVLRGVTVDARNPALSLSAGIRDIGQASIDIADSTLLVTQDLAVGIRARGSLEANNVVFRINGTGEGSVVLAGGGARVALRNSVADVFFPYNNGYTSRALEIESGATGLSAVVAGNVFNFHSASPSANVPPYVVPSAGSGSLLSHANVFRDRNGNIAAMADDLPSFGSFVVLHLADFVDVAV